MATSFPVAKRISQVLDSVAKVGEPRIAGGAVRDWLLGFEAKDIDVEVFKCGIDELLSVLKKLGKVDLVGKAFGVLKFRTEGHEIDFSFPRKEIKTEMGHRGFDVEVDPELSPEIAAARRDFTINAISYDWKTGTLIDPFGGQADLKNKILRHTSEAFVEDPLRVLRGFQFCSRFGLEAAQETIGLCRSIKNTYSELAIERVWAEWEKWATRSVLPSYGLRFLEETGWLEHFPEIQALVDCPQEPEWHPEGDAFTHTLHCLDALSARMGKSELDSSTRLMLMFAVLCHDFGKPETTERIEKNGLMRWTSRGHDQAGGPLTLSFLGSISAPLWLYEKVKPLVLNHMVTINIKNRPTFAQVRRLARKLTPATLADLFFVIRADIAGRPPLSAEPTTGLKFLEAVAYEAEVENDAPKPIVFGRHLIERGLKPGPQFGDMLEQLFEQQLDGGFATLEEAEPFIVKVCEET